MKGSERTRSLPLGQKALMLQLSTSFIARPFDIPLSFDEGSSSMREK
jgi:hypothetical protein